MHLGFLIVDGVVVLTSLAALLCAAWERRRIVRRGHVLLPGMLAAAASVALVAYPRWSDLWEIERFAVGLAALVVGGLRGRAMHVAWDRAHDVVGVRNPADAIVVAALMVLISAIGFVLDLRAQGLSRIAPTVEFAIIVGGAYLMGRSMVLWHHARTSVHVDLVED